MKQDRQFMTMLGLVVAAGLVMGLIAFRMTGGSAAVETASAGNSAVANPNAPRPSAADAEVDSPPESTPLVSDADSQNGEPAPPATDLPEMQGPTNGDPPAVALDQASAPAVAPQSDTAPPSGDAPPQ